MNHILSDDELRAMSDDAITRYVHAERTHFMVHGGPSFFADEFIKLLMTQRDKLNGKHVKIPLSTDYAVSVPAYGVDGKVIGRTVTRDGGSSWHYEPTDAAGTPLLPCVPPKCIPERPQPAINTPGEYALLAAALKRRTLPVSEAKSWSSQEWIFHSRQRTRSTYTGPIYDQRELTAYAQFLGTDMLGAAK